MAEEYSWGDYRDRKNLYNKLVEILAKLVEILAATDGGAREGTPIHFNKPQGNNLLITVASGKKLQVFGWFYWTTGDTEAYMKWGSGGTEYFAGLKGQGVVGMNLTTLEPIEGGNGEDLYILVESAVNARGTVWVKEVDV